MGKLKSWGVKCPEDYATNQKWKDNIDWLNKKHCSNLKGNIPYAFYGIIKTGKYDCTSSITLFDQIITIDEAHSMLFDNVIIKKQILTDYQKLSNAGFERQTIEDQVYFDVHGQHPFLMVKKLAKKTKIVWNSVDDSIELMAINKDGDVMFRKALELDEVVG